MFFSFKCCGFFLHKLLFFTAFLSCTEKELSSHKTMENDKRHGGEGDRGEATTSASASAFAGGAAAVEAVRRLSAQRPQKMPAQAPRSAYVARDVLIVGVHSGVSGSSSGPGSGVVRSGSSSRVGTKASQRIVRGIEAAMTAAAAAAEASSPLARLAGPETATVARREFGATWAVTRVTLRL